MDHAAVQAWLDAYVHAWETYDPNAIAALFAEDAICYYHPYDEPVVGREAIVASWINPPRRDAPNTYAGHYEPLVVEGSLAVAHGRTQYFREDGKTPRGEFDNIFFLRFDADGRCSEYREWYMEPLKADE